VSTEPSSRRVAQAANLFDLRRIIAGVFLVWGVLLIILGATDSDAEIDRAAGININLWAGIGMLVVGIIFLVWSLTRPFAESLREAEEGEPASSPAHAPPRGVDAAALGSEQARRRVRGDRQGTVRPDDPGRE
jgi:hypothetical protein